MRKSIALSLLFLLAGSISVGHAGLYRWVDEDGNVHYSDNIPPEHVRSGHTELSDRGLRVKTVPAAKTNEEVEQEQELERLRVQQEELLEQQRTADRVLLRTFRSEDDIAMARDGKIASIDVMIGVTKNNIRLQQEKHARLIAEAADLERAKKPVPEHLVENIAQAERMIRDAYAAIVAREEQKQSIRQKFDRDLGRFRELKDLPAAEPEPARETRPPLHNIVTCADATECSHRWAKATAYVDQHSTTRVQSSSATVVITAPPVTERDLSLILSRINDEDGPGASLFLDLRCSRTARGRAACEGQEAQSIIEGFRSAITGKDATRAE